MRRILALCVALLCCAVPIACGEDSMDATGGDEGAMRATGDGSASEDASTGEDGSASQDASAADSESAAGQRRGPLVKLRDSQLGPVLFSGSDRAVYLFTRDRKRVSRCFGRCAVAWPPFFANGRPRAGPGVKRSLLGTIRRGGRRQVTYAGQPLYFYVSDPRGQVLCNDIVEFGGTWFALTSEGKAPA